MRFILHSSVAFEPWDWRNSVETGIGGSETSHVEMAWRLAARGHEVLTYAPLPKDCPGRWRNTTWKHIDDTDWSLPGIWIIYRNPSLIEHFDRSRTDQTVWLLMQDWDYQTWKPEHLERLDKVLVMSPSHGRYVLETHPMLAGKIVTISNGLKLDLVEQIESEQIVRNPHKIMFASSPDRGLHALLKSFTKARQYVPDLELHAFYGFNNIDKILAQTPKSSYAKIKRDIEAYRDTPGVHLHGRVNQIDLYRHWFSAGLWVYQTMFNETSCITSMEAQAMGAIPIFNPIFALGDNVQWGVAIQGDAYGDPLTISRYATEIVRLATQPALQESIRVPMMSWARQHFNWERQVDQWVTLAEETYALQ